LNGMRSSTIVFVIAGVFGFTAVPALAVTTISFDQLQVGEDVLNYYNGGLGSMGSGPGPSDGVLFSAGWVVGGPDVYGTPGGESAAISGTEIVDLPAGLFGPTSFYYEGGPLTVNFYSEQNGLGSLVATLTESGTSSFSAAGRTVPFFQSAVFIAPAGDRIDALTNGTLVTPEPGTLQLFLLASGVFGLAALRWRQPLLPALPDRN
jgi:hypothetical protein